MLALNKNLRIAFVLPVWFLLAFLISYLALSRTRTTGPRNPQPDHFSGIPGKTVRLDAEKPASSVSLDSDSDGIPDAAELRSFTDRQKFRSWFSGIAEMQFYRLSDQWNVEQRDCAGLVRFAWREALRRHDRAWFLKMGAGYDDIATDISTYHLNEGPLGEKLFRTDFGTYKQSDLAEAKFSEFADARTLKNFNSQFVSRDRRLAEPGDLLFYHQPWVQKFPYHVMIFLGDSRFAAPDTHDWVVYHTGASPTDKGVVKKVELSVLDKHPNKRWRPVESNPNFLGFYRLKILD
ncbi:MAG: DUF1175 family protein [Pyrinomonadaceae bacterium]